MARILGVRKGSTVLDLSVPVRLGLAAWMAWMIVPTVMGKEPVPPRVMAREPVPAKVPPTFTRDVAPILQQKCQNCHRRHHVGPFALETYEQARKRAEDIATVAADRMMPPWKPARGVGPKLKHDQSLSQEEISILEAWAEAGAPRGDPKDMPPPPQFTEGWKLGPPDLVLEATKDFSMPASGPDTYRCFVLPTNLKRDTYISAIDFQPANLRVVHHINAFIDTSGDARKRDAAEPGPGYTSFAGPGIDSYEELSFWTPGHEPSHFPPGIGQRLSAQCDVILQVHYHPTGKPEADRTRVGIYFSRGPIRQALHWNTASNSDFQIAAGDSNAEVKATWYIPTDLEALAVSPHMHLLGRDMRITVTDPKGRTQDLIHIPEWDPAWQSTYFFQKPILLPRGSIVNVIAHFNNSAFEKPEQPPKLVKWGFGANDEMCEGFIAVVKKGQDLTVYRTTDDLGEIFARQRLKNMGKQFAKKPH